MTNKYIGEVSIAVAGKNCTLVYDWRAISALHTQFSDDLKAGLIDVDKITCPLKLAEIAAIGFERKNPELTADALQKIAPPIVILKQKIDEALASAYFGADLLDGLKKANQALKDKKARTAAPEPAKKKKK